jgi:drug/metabolite transporter (DMT)-like permease
MVGARKDFAESLFGGWLRPDVAVLLSAAMWGTIWVPIRQLNGIGWDSGLAAAASALAGTLCVLPFILRRWREALLVPPVVWFIGFLLGFGVALYWEGMARGNVARVVLLFYLMPVWTVVLARIVNRERVTLRRLLGIALGMAGMMVVFSREGGLPIPHGAGDYMGLLSGIAWALAFVLCARPGTEKTTLAQFFISLLFLTPTVYLLAVLPGSRETAAALGAASGAAAAIFWLVGLTTIWLLPGMFMTLYGADRLKPGQVAIFLMIEVVVALVSAAVLLDEPFGIPEIVGAVLILGASLVEFVGADSKQPGPVGDP